MEVTVTSEQKGQRENTVLLDKWKLSFWKGGQPYGGKDGAGSDDELF